MTTRWQEETPVTRRVVVQTVTAAAGGLALGLLDSPTGHAADTRIPGVHVENVPRARMLGPDVRRTLQRLHMRQAMTEASCLMTYEDQGYRAEAALVDRLPFQRRPVFRGSRQTGNYQHHAQVARFKGRYYLAWSNGLADEEAPGQQILVASSADGLAWSEPVPAVPRQAQDGLVHNCVGLLGTDAELFLFCWTELAIRDARLPGMRRIDAASKRVDLYASADGNTWQLRTPRLLDPGKDHAAMFEAPRPAAGGALLCGGSHNGPVVFRWNNADVTRPPDVVSVPPAAEASFPYGEATWYRAPDGLLVMFWRDEAQSVRLYVNSSADGGKTWTAPILSDIPNSMQRVFAGNLADGRAFLINDANPRLLDRRQLTLALSKDGRVFDRIYMLVDDPVRQRFPGLLKAHGWQYPCALVDGERMLIAYSVNKEDIECGVVDLARL